jgi:Recombination enhancement, RecA-dependent nuclease
MNEKQYLNIVASLGCAVCGKEANIHHPRFCCGMGQRASSWLGFPLCPDHHQYGGFGVAIHASQVAFEKNFGTEQELLAKTIQKVVSELHNDRMPF